MESKIVDNYESVTLHQSLLISKLFTVHYFEYMNDFSFPGEAHNFWEFLCVDKGGSGCGGRKPEPFPEKG